jgi:hypothetical protein
MFHFGDRSFGYNPKVDNPSMTNNITQMRSAAFQAPFFFGGSQVPIDLGIKGNSRGAGIRGGVGGKKGMLGGKIDPTLKRGMPPVVDWRSNPVLPAGQNAATAWASSASAFRRK